MHRGGLMARRLAGRAGATILATGRAVVSTGREARWPHKALRLKPGLLLLPAFITAALLLLAGGLNALGPEAEAAGNSADKFSLDMDPAGNAPTTLGTREACIALNPAGTATIDLTVTNIPAGTPMALGFGTLIVYNAAVMKITSVDTAQMISASPGSAHSDFSDPTPDTDGEFNVSGVDLGPMPGAAESGSGVLTRLGIEINSNAVAGVYDLTILGGGTIDAAGVAHPPDQVENAQVAVNTACPAGGTPTPTPEPTPTPTPTPPPEPSLIRVGSGVVDIGGSITVDVTVQNAPGVLVGGIQANVEFDPVLLDAADCASLPLPDGICNPDYDSDGLNPDSATCIATSLGGFAGDWWVCSITFVNIACQPGQTVTLHPVAVDFFDTNVSPLPTTTEDGLIACGTPAQATVRVGSGTVAPGGTITLPVEVIGAPAPGVGAVSVEAQFDPAVLDATACTKDPGSVYDGGTCNAEFDNNGVNPDSAKCNATSATGVPGDSVVCTVTFETACQAGDTMTVHPVVSVLSDPSGDPIPVIVEDGIITCGLPGDVNCDGSVDSIDALFILQYDVGLRASSDQCPPTAGTLHLPLGDVNCDGNVDSIDALFILQYDVGLRATLGCSSIVGVPTPTPLPPTGS